MCVQITIHTVVQIRGCFFVLWGVLWVSLGFIEVSSVVGITFESDTVKSLSHLEVTYCCLSNWTSHCTNNMHSHLTM